MANSPDEVMDLLTQISTKAKQKAKKEIEEIKSYFNLDEIQAWDVVYYSRILKEKKYSFDDKKLKEYFEFENTKKALFDTVKKLYNVELKPIKND
jgi:Zn-dependent oligopeptidase